MKAEDLVKYEIGKEYIFKAESRKRAIRGILLDKDCYFTGLSLYHGTKAIKFKTKRNIEYTLSLYGIEKIIEII